LCAGPSWAAAKTVCSSGCPDTTIQGAIEAAAPGATITIAGGSYYEDIKVTKPVTLIGSGPATVIYPGVSQPTCPVGSSGSLCEGKASAIVEVEASNVTIERMKLDGNNPNLTSGDVVEGQDIDARDGIIENYEAGSFDDLTIAKVTIDNIYLRALYASSEGTGFNFNHDTIQNVQGEEESIAVFDFGGSGEISHNRISDAQDAIALNWSTGSKIEHNSIAKSASGIHTDNNGGKGGTADIIKENKIYDCASNGYGIYTFASRVATPTVEDNKVVACDVALAAFGSEGVVGTDAAFVGNHVNGQGASTTEAEGPIGIYLSTSLLGYGYGPMTATVSANRFEHLGVGLYASQLEGGQASITAHQNLFTEVALGAYGESGTVVSAEENWWGCKQGPNAGGKCAKVEGTVAYTPWRTSK
jgi:nitrous oxidase accessory protein NosD